MVFAPDGGFDFLEFSEIEVSHSRSQENICHAFWPVALHA